MGLVTAEHETIDGAAIVQFLEMIRAAYSEAPRIYLIVDGPGITRRRRFE